MALLTPDSRLQHANPRVVPDARLHAPRVTGAAADALNHPDDRQRELVPARAPAGGRRRSLPVRHALPAPRRPRRLGPAAPARWCATATACPCISWRRCRTSPNARRPKPALQHARSAWAPCATASRQAQLLDQARDAIVVHDLDRAIRHWNMGAQRMFGFTARADRRPHASTTLMGPARQPAGRPPLPSCWSDGEWIGPLECIDAGGRMLIVERHCMLMRDAAGQPLSVLAVNTDVTERQRAEKEIVLLNNAAGAAHPQAHGASCEESNEDLRDFAYSLAHDLRAPLASDRWLQRPARAAAGAAAGRPAAAITCGGCVPASS